MRAAVSRQQLSAAQLGGGHIHIDCHMPFLTLVESQCSVYSVACVHARLGVEQTFLCRPSTQYKQKTLTKRSGIGVCNYSRHGSGCEYFVCVVYFVFLRHLASKAHSPLTPTGLGEPPSAPGRNTHSNKNGNKSSGGVQCGERVGVVMGLIISLQVRMSAWQDKRHLASLKRGHTSTLACLWWGLWVGSHCMCPTCETGAEFCWNHGAMVGTESSSAAQQ